MRYKRLLMTILAAVIWQLLLTPGVQAASKTDYGLYLDFLQQDCYRYTSSRQAGTKPERQSLTFYDTYGDRRYEIKTLYFNLLDLNGDSVRELVVARMAHVTDPPMLRLYVFTIRGGRVCFVKNLLSEYCCFASTGTSLLYSRRYRALYCPYLEQNSDARADDETRVYTLMAMRARHMKTIARAEIRRVRETAKGSAAVKTWRYMRKDGSMTEAPEETEDFKKYCNAYFRDLDLEICPLYPNNAKYRKLVLG